VAVSVGVGVEVSEGVGVGVEVSEGVGVEVSLGVGVAVSVAVGVEVSLGVGVEVSEGVGVEVFVGVGVEVSVGVGVEVREGVEVALGVGVGVEVALGVEVGLGVGVSIGGVVPQTSITTISTLTCKTGWRLGTEMLPGLCVTVRPRLLKLIWSPRTCVPPSTLEVAFVIGVIQIRSSPPPVLMFMEVRIVKGKSLTTLRSIKLAKSPVQVTLICVSSSTLFPPTLLPLTRTI
jgi:hypothetical protein